MLYSTNLPQSSQIPLNWSLTFNTETTKGSLQKKNCVFCDIGPKGGWVPVSKHNFFWRRNCDIYQRWVGVKHRCHNFIYSFPFVFFAYFHFPICKFWLIYVCLIEYKITITFKKLKMCMCIQRHQILCSMWGSKNQIKYDLCHILGGVGG